MTPSELRALAEGDGVNIEDREALRRLAADALEAPLISSWDYFAGIRDPSTILALLDDLDATAARLAEAEKLLRDACEMTYWSVEQPSTHADDAEELHNRLTAFLAVGPTKEQER